MKVIKKYYKRPSSSPIGCKKMKEERDRENKSITEKRNRSLSTRRKTLYQILGRAAPLTFQCYTSAIEKVMKIFQE